MGLLRWLDHWTYERKLAKCDHCGKRAFCYYGVCLDIGNGTGNFCGMGCPSCKKEAEREREERLKADRGPTAPVGPVPNRRAAVMATRRRRAQVQG